MTEPSLGESANGNGRRMPQVAAPGVGHGEKLTRRHHAAIAALLSEATIGGAAIKAKIGERTLRRWMTLPAFRAAYNAARAEAFDNAMRALQSYSVNAAQTLNEVAGDKAAPSAARVAAARAILENTANASILARIENLEAAQMNRIARAN